MSSFGTFTPSLFFSSKKALTKLYPSFFLVSLLDNEYNDIIGVKKKEKITKYFEVVDFRLSIAQFFKESYLIYHRFVVFINYFEENEIFCDYRKNCNPNFLEIVEVIFTISDRKIEKIQIHLQKIYLCNEKNFDTFWSRIKRRSLMTSPMGNTRQKILRLGNIGQKNFRTCRVISAIHRNVPFH